MDFDYKFLYKTIINFKTTTNENEVAGKEYKIVIDPKTFREIERNLGYLEELRADSKQYLLELNIKENKNKSLKTEIDLLKEENIKLKKDLESKTITEVSPLNNNIMNENDIVNELENKLEEKHNEIIGLKRQLKNFSSIIDSKNKKVDRLDVENTKLERRIIKLKNKNSKIFNKANKDEITENEIKPTYKSFIVKKVNRTRYKVEKHYVLNIDIQMKVKDVREYIYNINENDKELSEFINDNGYVITKVQTKNDKWEVILLKETLAEEQGKIDFSYESFILGGLSMADSYYIINQHYVLPLPIETSINEVVDYVKNSKITNKELEQEKVDRDNKNENSIYENIAWKIQTKNDKWEVVFRGKFTK